MENGVLRTEEVYRFPNSVRRVDGHLEWDIDSLFVHVKQGIREAFAKYPEIESLSIDTWALWNCNPNPSLPNSIPTTRKSNNAGTPKR